MRKIEKTEIPYPVRINRYLYLKNICSRRKADDYIEKGLVKINGKKAMLGSKVEKGDKVTIDQKVSLDSQSYSYIVFNKPKGIVSHNPQKGQTDAASYIDKKHQIPRKVLKKLAVLGRLDKESHGLLLLSDDGRIVDKLLNPKFEHEKEYEVMVDKRVIGEFLKKMASGVRIEGYKTKKAKTARFGTRGFKIVLTEGKKHQIRRMCAALGYQVEDLKRTRVMNITLGNLAPGKTRMVKGSELSTLLSSLGL